MRAAQLAMRRLGLIAACLALGSCSKGGEELELCAALAQHHLAHLYAQDVELTCPGVRREPMPANVAQTLRGTDPSALRAALTAHKASLLAIKRGSAKGPSVAAKLARLAFVPELRAIAITPGLALYAARRDPELSPSDRDGLAYVARALLRGAREPSLNSFPPALRRVERVEVMVLLRERGAARLWRSARGTSLARALLTATRVARDRWRERESAMGGALAERLLDLSVEVSLLSEDGVIVGPTQKLVESAIGPAHGIGFEYKSGWHYLLPEDVQRRGKGSAYRALLSLMSEQGVAATALSTGVLRVYRFVTLTLGSSSAPLGGDSPG